MSECLKRYRNSVLVNHLAMNYVLGLLPSRVQQRVQHLRMHVAELQQRIVYWEQHFAELDQHVEDIAPLPDTWAKITQRIWPDSHKSVAAESGWRRWLAWRWQGAAVCSFLLASVLAIWLVMMPEPAKLSYVAVLENSQHQAQLVATLYGKQQLVLNILSPQTLATGQQAHLWVTSKTDQSVHHLGVVPVAQKWFKRELSTAEWQLIKDSDELWVTFEPSSDAVPVKPSGEIVARGLCVQLIPWKEA